MLELFGDGGPGRPPHGGDYPYVGGDDDRGGTGDDINVEDTEDDKGEKSLVSPSQKPPSTSNSILPMVKI